MMPPPPAPAGRPGGAAVFFFSALHLHHKGPRGDPSPRAPTNDRPGFTHQGAGGRLLLAHGVGGFCGVSLPSLSRGFSENRRQAEKAPSFLFNSPLTQGRDSRLCLAHREKINPKKIRANARKTKKQIPPKHKKNTQKIPKKKFRAYARKKSPQKNFRAYARKKIICLAHRR